MARLRIYIGPPRTDSLTTGMTDYSAKLVQKSWNLSQTRGSTIDVISFEILDVDNSVSITRGHDIIVEEFSDATFRHFGGLVTMIDYVPFGVGRRIVIEGQDYTALTDRSTVRKTYEAVGQIGRDIIQNAFTEAGITEINTVQAEPFEDAPSTATGGHVYKDRLIDIMHYQGESLRAILDMLSSLSGFMWYIDAFKKLHYVPKRARTFSNIEFAETPNNVTSFPYYDFRFRQHLGSYNVINLVGGAGKSAAQTETYAGKVVEGVATKIFYTHDDGHNPIDWPNTNEDVIGVERNTGTNSTPIWTTMSVGTEADSGFRLDASTKVLWNFTYRKLEFHTAPQNIVNGFRVKGRYTTPVIVIASNTTAIARHGRTFTGVLNVTEATEEAIALDLANAYLTEVGDKSSVSFTMNVDGLQLTRETRITNAAMGLNAQAITVDRITTKILGAETFEYRVEGEFVTGVVT